MTSVAKKITFGLNKSLEDILDLKSLHSAIKDKASKDIASQSKKGLMSSTDKIKLDGLENYTHPESHEASMIIQDTNHRFVTDAEKEKWNNSNSGSDFDLGSIQEQISNKADRDHTHEQYIENNDSVTFKGEIKASKVTIDNNKSLVGLRSDSGFVDMIYLDPDNNINIGYQFNANTLVNCQMIHKGNVTMDNSSMIFKKTNDKVARLEYFSSPSKLQLYWSDSNDGSDWNWTNAITFSSEGHVASKALFVEGRKISVDGTIGGLCMLTDDGRKYSNFACGTLYLGPHGGSTVRANSEEGLDLKFLVSDGSRYAQLTCGAVNLGPYSGSTVKLSAGSQAPSSPANGDIWIQI